MLQPMISPPIFREFGHENRSGGHSGESGGSFINLNR